MSFDSPAPHEAIGRREEMHRHVVRIDGESGENLLAEADADPRRIRVRSFQCPVVVTLAAAEAEAVGREGHAGAEEQVDLADRADRRVRRRFVDPEAPGGEGGRIGEMEAHRIAIDPRQHPAPVGKTGEQRQQPRFAGERGEAGDGPRGVVGQPVAEVAADRGRLGELGIRVRPRPAEGAAQFGFRIAGTCHLQWPGWSGNLAAVIRRWQAIVLSLCLPVLAADEKPKFEWNPPKTGAGVFTDALGMLDREREEYADNLAGYASNQVAAAKASVASLAEARRLVALALHLSPRNRKALVLSFQLSRGVLPEAVPGDYRPDVLAGLLHTRGQVLKQQGGAENGLLARIFTELAAEMDPKNDDAVYASELQRLDQGAVDWSALTDVKPAAIDGPDAEGMP